MAQDSSRSGRTNPSRRQFIQKSSLIMASGALASNLTIARSAHAAGDDQIKIAVIGCGGRGTGAASQALSTKGNVKLVAMADAFQDRLEGALRGLQKQHGDKVDVPKERQFVGFDGYKHAIDAGVDLVILATPPGFRPIHFEAAVKAGKHVFMEKPVAVDAPGVRMVLAAAEEAKKKNLGVGVGLQRHHENKYIETIRRLQEGAIGDIVATRVYWNGAGVWVRPRQPGQTEMEYQMRNWYYYTWLSGDHNVEQHVHSIDKVAWLMRDEMPVRAWGLGGRQQRTESKFGHIFDHHAVVYEYANGTRAFAYCRQQNGCYNEVGEIAIGTKGTAEVPGARINGETKWRFDGPRPSMYQVEHDELFASIRSGNPIHDGEIMANSTMMTIMGRMVTYTGQALTWDQVINSEEKLGPEKYEWGDVPEPSVAVPGVTKFV